LNAAFYFSATGIEHLSGELEPSYLIVRFKLIAVVEIDPDDTLHFSARNHNPCVGGSIPSPATNSKRKKINKINKVRVKRGCVGDAPQFPIFGSFRRIFAESDAPVLPFIFANFSPASHRHKNTSTKTEGA